MERKVIQGTCGWSDESLLKCGRFYPPKMRNSADKLQFYSRGGGFGCVEVDSSTYAIPSVDSVRTWIDATPKDFVFHVKAFGLLCNGGIDIRHLPQSIRSYSKRTSGWVTLESIGADGVAALWNLFNASILPIHAAGKLGCIVFQFQLNFLPTTANKDYIRTCATYLHQSCRMAIEFRERAWTSESQLADTVALLASIRREGVALIASDDLEHEMYQSDKNQLGSSSVAKHMPIAATARSSPEFFYVRVHRRHGNQRVLSDSEISLWCQRIQDVLNEQIVDDKTPAPITSDSIVASQLRGPIYVLWGTDHEDQPIINAKKLYNALPESTRFDWTAAHRSQKATLNNLFSTATSAIKPAVVSAAASNSANCPMLSSVSSPTVASCAGNTNISKEALTIDLTASPIAGDCGHKNVLTQSPLITDKPSNSATSKRPLEAPKAPNSSAKLANKSAGALFKYFKPS